VRETWSQFEQAWRDTVVHKAEAAAFQPLCRFYGVPQPVGEILEPGWAQVLKLVAYGSKGNFETTYRATEAAFSQFNQKVDGHVDSAAPSVLVAPGGWPANVVNRLIRKKDKLYFSKSLTSSTELEVVDMPTLYWDAPEEPDGVNLYTFEILPFVVNERSPGLIVTTRTALENIYGESTAEDFFTKGEHCLFEVILFVNSVRPPMTWLQRPTSYASPASVLTQDDVPYGGALLSNESDKGNAAGKGPHPLYAYDGLIFPLAAKTLSSTLASAVEYRVLLSPPIV
jgi:hypothetical protein